MQEIWKPVVGYEKSYEVSDLGRVRSLSRFIRGVSKAGNECKRLKSGRELKPGASSNGYLTVTLNGRSWCIQYLVLSAFVGPRPEKEVCRHLDGVRTNNYLNNLKWVTPKENRADADTHVTSVRGEAYPNAKLTNLTARVIRRLHRRISQNELAKLFKVSHQA